MYYFWKKLFGFIFALLWLAINLEFIILMHAKPRSINGIRTLQILILCEGSFKRVLTLFWWSFFHSNFYSTVPVLVFYPGVVFYDILIHTRHLYLVFLYKILHAGISSLNNSIEDRIYISGCMQWMSSWSN